MTFKNRVPAALIAGVVSVASLLAGGVGANAAGGGAAAIAFSNASSVDAVYWVGNGSLGVSAQTYNYFNPNQGGGDTCTAAVANGGSTVLPATGAYNCSGTSNGSYINVVCGTGLVGSVVGASAANIYSQPGYTGATITANIQAIVFVNGLGVLVAQANDPDHDAALGVVQISPKNPANLGNPGGFAQSPGPNNLCVNGFNVSGAVLATASS